MNEKTRSVFPRCLSRGLRRAAILALVGATPFCRLHAQEPRITVNLEFSLDGGRTYSDAFPLLPEAREILVRASWNIDGETRTVHDGIVTSSLFSTQTDFASANRGRQTHGPVAAWMQRLSPYFRMTITGMDIPAHAEAPPQRIPQPAVAAAELSPPPLPLLDGAFRFGAEHWRVLAGPETFSLLELVTEYRTPRAGRPDPVQTQLGYHGAGCAVARRPYCRRSLEINLNQPDVIRALDEVQP